jgi:hypothetical protein
MSMSKKLFGGFVRDGRLKGAARTGALALVFLFICGIPQVGAKEMELTPFGGFTFGGKVSGWEGDLNIIDGMNYGASLNIGVQPGVWVELLYNRQDTKLEVKEWRTGMTRDLFDMSVEYFMAGVVRETSPEDVRPFVTMLLGASRFHPKTDKYGDEWLFTACIGGGIKAFSESGRFGLRLQGRLWLPLQFSGGSLWCGSGGCSAGLSSWAPFVQGELSVGLIIALGEKE